MNKLHCLTNLFPSHQKLLQGFSFLLCSPVTISHLLSNTQQPCSHNPPPNPHITLLAKISSDLQVVTSHGPFSKPSYLFQQYLAQSIPPPPWNIPFSWCARLHTHLVFLLYNWFLFLSFASSSSFPQFFSFGSVLGLFPSYKDSLGDISQAHSLNINYVLRTLKTVSSVILG